MPFKFPFSDPLFAKQGKKCAGVNCRSCGRTSKSNQSVEVFQRRCRLLKSMTHNVHISLTNLDFENLIIWQIKQAQLVVLQVYVTQLDKETRQFLSSFLCRKK